jgi:hypothetical protein
MNSHLASKYATSQPYLNDTAMAFFSDANVDLVKRKLEILLRKFRMNGKVILVAKETIINVMNEVYITRIGRLHEMNDMVIEIVYDAISNEVEQIEYNNKLDKRTAMYQHPESLLQRHPPIKLNTRKPSFGFNMNY